MTSCFSAGSPRSLAGEARGRHNHGEPKSVSVPEIRRILRLIEAIRQSRPDAEYWYTHGGCWQFHLILRTMWPDAVPIYHWDEGHVYSEIAGRLYDIRGIRVMTVAEARHVRPMDASAMRRAHRWKPAPDDARRIA